MIFSAHQPNYLPWLGYFYKILNSDVFIVLDDVQFEKRSYQSRVQIKTPAGAQWMTQPVLQNYRQKTSDVAFDPDANWRAKHLRQLQVNYARAPYCKAFHGELTNWFDEAKGSQSEVNLYLIRKISDRLGAHAEIVKSSSYNVSLMGSKRLAELGKRVGATVYLSGRGARVYQDEADFLECGQSLHYTSFKSPPYPQVHGDFVDGLSIIDAIFNLSFDGVTDLLRAAKAPVPEDNNKSNLANYETV